MSNAAQWEAAIAAAMAAADTRHNRAERDALRDYLADLPDPEQYARYLPEAFVIALRGAFLSRGSMCVPESVARFLRPHGLVEYGGCCLTNFGNAVRKALPEEDA